jgi:hypothetical protein
MAAALSPPHLYMSFVFCSLFRFAVVVASARVLDVVLQRWVHTRKRRAPWFLTATEMGAGKEDARACVCGGGGGGRGGAWASEGVVRSTVPFPSLENTTVTTVAPSKGVEVALGQWSFRRCVHRGAFFS